MVTRWSRSTSHPSHSYLRLVKIWQVSSCKNLWRIWKLTARWSWQSFESSNYVLNVFLHWIYKMKCCQESFVIPMVACLLGFWLRNAPHDKKNNTINWRDTTHFDSEDDYRTGCWNVSHCQQQQSHLGLRSPGRSCSTYSWNDSWVQTLHTFSNLSNNHSMLMLEP